MRASLLAMATTSTLRGARASSAFIHPPIANDLALCASLPHVLHGSALAEIDVAALTDAEQLRLAAGGVLSRHQAEPCREVSPLAECCAVADGGNDGCRDDRANARDLTDAATTSITSAICSSLSVSSSICCSTVFHSSHSSRSGYASRCKSVIRVLENICHPGLQLRRLLREDHAAFQQKGAYLVDDCRAT